VLAGGSPLVIEEKFDGEEFSLQCLCDGKTVVGTPLVQDHKRRFDGDKGPNTGGMGSYSLADHLLPFLNPRDLEEGLEITRRVAAALLQETGQPYKGIMYGGFIATRDGVRLLEYNARFGDPETQVVLPLLKTDLLDIVEAVIEGRLDELEIEWEEKTGFTVVCACAGYPASSQKGLPIEIGELGSDIILYHAGTKLQDGKPVTNGGRVFSVTTVKENIESARKTVYAEIDKIKFSGMRYRKDIGIK